MKTFKIDKELSRLFELQGGDTTQNTPHHFGTVKEHTDMVRFLVWRYANMCKNRDYTALYIAAWLHDIGKLKTKKTNPKTGYDCFYGHSKVSADTFRKWAWVTSISEIKLSYIYDLVKYHDARFQEGVNIIDICKSHTNEWVNDFILLSLFDVLAQSMYQRDKKVLEIVNLVEELQGKFTIEPFVYLIVTYTMSSVMQRKEVA